MGGWNGEVERTAVGAGRRRGKRSRAEKRRCWRLHRRGCRRTGNPATCGRPLAKRGKQRAIEEEEEDKKMVKKKKRDRERKDEGKDPSASNGGVGSEWQNADGEKMARVEQC